MIRSALFLVWFAAVSAILSIVFCPVLILPRSACVWLARTWARATLWGLRVIARIDMRVTGAVPFNDGKGGGGVLVAAKHMSMWDTLALYIVLDDPAIVLKRELLYIPFYGWFLWKATAIAIDRDAGASALRKMTNEAKKVIAAGRPILIFPEGTRKKPGAPPDYKPGVAAIYGLLGKTCVPVALDSGRYWTSFRKTPGTITLAFLEAIPPGLKRAAFMQILENRIEVATNKLLSA